MFSEAGSLLLDTQVPSPPQLSAGNFFFMLNGCLDRIRVWPWLFRSTLEHLAKLVGQICKNRFPKNAAYTGVNFAKGDWRRSLSLTSTEYWPFFCSCNVNSLPSISLSPFAARK